MNKRNITLKSFLINSMKSQWKLFIWVIILPHVWTLEQIAFPYFIKILIDIITNFNGNKYNIFLHVNPILWWGLCIWLLIILGWKLLDMLDVYLIPHFISNIRLNLFKHVGKHSHNFFSNELIGTLGSKIADLSQESWQIVSFMFKELCPAIAFIAISIWILGKVSFVFALIIFLYFTTHISICLFLSKKCQNLSNKHAARRAKLQGSIVDSLSNIMNVRLFSRNDHEFEYVKNIQNEEIKSYKSLLWSLFSVRLILEIPSIVMVSGTVWFLIYEWQKGLISLGDFALVITLSFNILIFVWRLGAQLPAVYRQIGICEEALNLIRLSYEITDAPNAPSLKVIKGEIAFKNVDFAYTQEQTLFKGLNVEILQGEKVGLVGYSGSGKSSFINLILRLFDVHRGEILIDGQNIANITQDSLRHNITVIPQDITLFHRSLLDNIKYGNIDASMEEVIEASKKAFCHKFIIELNRGYDTLIGERGIKLSFGQRQRIAIARAFLKDAPILILDEATSALDSFTERKIHKSLNKLMHNKTVIVIAHHLSTLLNMDRILVFNNGKIIEQGTHHYLLSKNGHYAKLWQMQAEGNMPEI